MKIFLEKPARNKFLCIAADIKENDDGIFASCLDAFNKAPYEFYTPEYEYEGEVIPVTLYGSYDLESISSSWLKERNGETIINPTPYVVNEIVNNKWYELVEAGTIPNDQEWWKTQV
ncbi:hypothetical protein [Enterococcus sp. AZ180]|uniref:hypothetical protein n=1 Tax=Enterococcus sp. AZ180 TaxID=2774961 RepID=UPI003F278A35